MANRPMAMAKTLQAIITIATEGLQAMVSGVVDWSVESKFNISLIFASLNNKLKAL